MSGKIVPYSPTWVQLDEKFAPALNINGEAHILQSQGKTPLFISKEKALAYAKELLD